jgi:hypothetical protein
MITSYIIRNIAASQDLLLRWRSNDLGDIAQSIDESDLNTCGLCSVYDSSRESLCHWGARHDSKLSLAFG